MRGNQVPESAIRRDVATTNANRDEAQASVRLDGETRCVAEPAVPVSALRGLAAQMESTRRELDRWGYGGTPEIESWIVELDALCDQAEQP
jgi:hypothetical protein